YQFLKPYKLGALGGLLAIAAIVSMLAMPVYRMMKMWRKRGRLPDMKAMRVALTGIALGAITAIFFLLPLPVSRVRQTGVVQIEPEAAVPIYAPVSGVGARDAGVLAKLHVRDGQQVEEGAVLAEFTNREVEETLNEARSQLGVEKSRLQAAREQLQ